MIPPFDDHGLLPPGIHEAALEEIRARFGWTERRQTLLAGLSAWLAEWRAVHAPSYTVLVDGSFVRGKDAPDDIDVVLELPSHLPTPEALQFALWVQCTEHAAMKAAYHVDVWVYHPSLPFNLRAYFQYLGDKAALELDLDMRHPKGILRISP